MLKAGIYIESREGFWDFSSREGKERGDWSCQAQEDAGSREAEVKEGNGSSLSHFLYNFLQSLEWEQSSQGSWCACVCSVFRTGADRGGFFLFPSSNMVLRKAWGLESAWFSALPLGTLDEHICSP